MSTSGHTEIQADAESDDQQRLLGQSVRGNNPRIWISDKEWINYMKGDPNFRLTFSIFRVPKFLKDAKKEAYVPQTVSLGPLHHKSKELALMDHHKGRALRRMMIRCNIKKNIDADDMGFTNNATNAILNLHGKIKDAYEEGIHCDGQTLAWMLCLDGCCILEVLRTLGGHQYDPADKNDLIIGENKLVASNILKDIVMLENQIPLIVLLELLKLEVPDAGKLAVELVNLRRREGELELANLRKREEELEELELANLLMRKVDLELELANLPMRDVDLELTFRAMRDVDPDLRNLAMRELEKLRIRDVEPELANRQMRELDNLRMRELANLLLKGTWGLFKISCEDKSLEEWMGQRVEESDHVLGFLHKVITYKPSIIQRDQDEHRFSIKSCIGHCLLMLQGKDEALNHDFESIPTAVELKNVGIKFRGFNGGISGITFDRKRAVIYLPVVSITYGTEVLFRNLIALEMCRPSEPSYVNSYVNLMDDLIDSQEDVALLRSMGILTKLIGSDKEVADLFNGLCKDVGTTRMVNNFAEVKESVNKHYRDKIRIQFAELVRDHFSSSWKALATAGAIAILCLTIIQTIFTIISVYKK